MHTNPLDVSVRSDTRQWSHGRDDPVSRVKYDLENIKKSSKVNSGGIYMGSIFHIFNSNSSIIRNISIGTVLAIIVVGCSALPKFKCELDNLHLDEIRESVKHEVQHEEIQETIKEKSRSARFSESCK